MNKFQLAVALALVGVSQSVAFDLSGLAIGDSMSQTDALRAEFLAEQIDGPLIIRKYQLPSGNQLAVTALRNADSIVYIEMNWAGKKSGRLTDVPGFQFGSTLLSEIRETFGSNGYAHKEHMAFPIGEQIALFNTFGLAPAGAQAVTFVTLTRRHSANEPSQAVLDSIILADAAFLDTYWGEEKLLDPTYRPVELR